MGKWDNRAEGKFISEQLVKEKPTEKLKQTKKFIEDLIKYKVEDKLYTTYVKGLKKAITYNGRNKVYVDFNIDGTITGRLSCSAYKAEETMGVSLHTLPRNEEEEESGKSKSIRNLFIGGQDYHFLTVDFAAMELRVLAHIADEKLMQKAFIDDADLHTYTAQLIFKKKDISKKERQIAKTVSFLIVYGGGAFNLSETMNMSLYDAQSVIESYQKVYPGVFEYMEEVEKQIKAEGYVETIFGRRRNLPDIYAKDNKVVQRAFRQGLNTTIQSPASDLMTAAMVGICRRFRERKLNAKILGTVHDSVESKSKLGSLEEALTIVYDETVNYPLMKRLFNLNLRVPLKIEAEVGSSFGNGKPIHFKDGKPIITNEFFS